MLGRLLISIGQFDHFAIVIRASEKTDSSGKAVACKSRRDRDRRHKHQEGVQVRRTSVIDVRRVNPVADQRRLVLDGFMDNGVQLVISHDF